MEKAFSSKMRIDSFNGLIRDVKSSQLKGIKNHSGLWFGEELLKSYTEAIKASDERIRSNLIADPELLYKLIAHSKTCGDYEYQVVLMEMIFLSSSSELRETYANRFFPESQYLIDSFKTIRTCNFEYEVRKFLNEVNRLHNTIRSFKCTVAYLGHFKIGAPQPTNKLWLDINVKAQTISMYCDKDSLSDNTVSANSVECHLELITIDFKNIVKVTSAFAHNPEQALPTGTAFNVEINAPCSVRYKSSLAAAKAASLKFKISQASEVSRLEDVLCELFLNKYNKHNVNEDLIEGTRTSEIKMCLKPAVMRLSTDAQCLLIEQKSVPIPCHYQQRILKERQKLSEASKQLRSVESPDSTVQDSLLNMPSTNVSVIIQPEQEPNVASPNSSIGSLPTNLNPEVHLDKPIDNYNDANSSIIVDETVHLFEEVDQYTSERLQVETLKNTQLEQEPSTQFPKSCRVSIPINFNPIVLIEQSDCISSKIRDEHSKLNFAQTLEEFKSYREVLNQKESFKVSKNSSHERSTNWKNSDEFMPSAIQIHAISSSICRRNSYKSNEDNTNKENQEAANLASIKKNHQYDKDKCEKIVLDKTIVHSKRNLFNLEDFTYSEEELEDAIEPAVTKGKEVEFMGNFEFEEFVSGIHNNVGVEKRNEISKTSTPDHKMDSTEETSASDQEVCKKIVVEAHMENRGSGEQLKVMQLNAVEKVIQTSLGLDDKKDRGKISLTKEKVSLPKDKTKEVNSSCRKRGRPRQQKVSPDNFNDVLKKSKKIADEDDIPLSKWKFLDNEPTNSDIVDRLEFEKFTRSLKYQQKKRPNNRQKEKKSKRRKCIGRQKTPKPDVIRISPGDDRIYNAYDLNKNTDTPRKSLEQEEFYVETVTGKRQSPEFLPADTETPPACSTKIQTHQNILLKAPQQLDVLPEVPIGTTNNYTPKLERVFHRYVEHIVDGLEILEELAEDIPRFRGTNNINVAKTLLQAYL